MPVTIKPATHTARKHSGTEAAHSAEALLKAACPSEHENCKTIIQTSFKKFDTESPIHPSENGFVYACVAAYCDHHHLVVRPEDIWFAILTQLSLHVNANAEGLRSFFVAHEGQKELWIRDEGSLDFADFGAMARRMGKLVARHVIDPELRPWIIPTFSTTIESDQVVSSVIMMGALQKYFSYGFDLACGIPTVTLLGVRADWEEMLHRLEKLPNLGVEPAQFYNLLKPVLTHFVSSFDYPDTPETKDFWQKIAHQSSGDSGPDYLSGWITAFCFWDKNGRSMYAPYGQPPSGPVEIEEPDSRNPGCCLDGTLYHRVDIDSIPSGHSSVPVKVDDDGDVYNTMMVAGSMGIRVTSSGEALDDTDTGPGLDSLQPESGWWMFERIEAPEGEDLVAEDVDLHSSISSEKVIPGGDNDAVEQSSLFNLTAKQASFKDLISSAG